MMDKNTKLGIAIGTMLAFCTGSFMVTNADSLTRQLQFGMSGTDVGTLQSFLAKNSAVYSGLITNYFGSLTRAAVSKFQALNGLSQVGRVGPQTLALINQQMGGMSTGTTTTFVKMISNIATSTANGATTLSWNTAMPTQGIVYYSMYPMQMFENENSVSIQGSTVSDSNYATSHSVQIPNLASNTTYYYTIYTTDQSGNVNMTWPGILMWGTNTNYINPTQGTTTNSSTTIPTVSTTTASSTM